MVCSVVCYVIGVSVFAGPNREQKCFYVCVRVIACDSWRVCWLGCVNIHIGLARCYAGILTRCVYLGCARFISAHKKIGGECRKYDTRRRLIFHNSPENVISCWPIHAAFITSHCGIGICWCRRMWKLWCNKTCFVSVVWCWRMRKFWCYKSCFIISTCPYCWVKCYAWYYLNVFSLRRYVIQIRRSCDHCPMYWFHVSHQK